MKHVRERGEGGGDRTRAGEVRPALSSSLVLQYDSAEQEPGNENHVDICLSSSPKNRISLIWVLVALTVSYLYIDAYNVSAESQAGEREL